MTQKHAHEILLASAILQEKDPIEFINLKIQEETIGEGYVHLFKYLKRFIADYGKVPEAKTVKETFDFKFIKVKETSRYYKDSMVDGYRRKAIYTMCKQANDMSKAGEYEQAMTLITKQVGELNILTSQGNIIDFSKDGLDMFMDQQAKQLLQGDDGYIKLGWESFDKQNGGLIGGDVLSVIGRPACLSGDTKIYVSRKAKGSGRTYTLRQMYKSYNNGAWDKTIPTKVQSLKEDQTGLNRLEGILKCGAKETYTLITETGKEIRATEEHLFLTDNGFRPLKELLVGNTIICKAPNKEGLNNYKAPFRKEICTKLPYSPYPTRDINGCTYQRVMEQRAIYDATLNNLNLHDFLIALKAPNKFIFSDKKKHIHHKDSDCTNNAKNNLDILTNSEHGAEHASQEDISRRFGRNNIQAEKIKSIVYFGVEETYDLVCADPYNNYIAEGIVTHNSGKTYLTLNAAMYAWKVQKKIPLFVSMEVSPQALLNRIIAMYTNTYVTDVKKATISTKKKNEIVSSLEGLQDMPKFWIIDGNLSSTVSDIESWVGELKPDLVVVDGAYLIESENKWNTSFHEKIKQSCEGMKKRVAAKYDIPTILSYQFNRDATKLKDDEQASLEHIGGSDAIGQISSIVLGLFDGDDKGTTQKRKTISVLKGREGEQGTFDIHWVFSDYPSMCFDEITKEESYNEMNEEMGNV